MLLKTAAEKFLARGLLRLGLVLENQPETIARLMVYFQELHKWNSKVNLVARTLSDHQILEDHFLDSLTLLHLLKPNSRNRETLLDIGTGGGFPGLVLKTACPALDLTLIESRQNRFYFLKHIIRTLDLTGVKAYNLHLQGDAVKPELSGCRFSIVTSRAFADINRFIGCGAPYLEENGRIIVMKGPGAAEELKNMSRNETAKQFRVEEIKKLFLPFSGKERWLVSLVRTARKISVAG